MDGDKITSVNILNEIKPTACSVWFFCCKNLTEIKNIDNLNTSACTEMVCMFYNCESLTSLDASNWDTSKCTDMSYMFQTSGEFNTLSGHSLHGSCEEKIQYCREHIFDMTNVVNCEEMFGDEFA